MNYIYMCHLLKKFMYYCIEAMMIYIIYIYIVLRMLLYLSCYSDFNIWTHLTDSYTRIELSAHVYNFVYIQNFMHALSIVNIHLYLTSLIIKTKIHFLILMSKR